jgi:hypothetical protein
VFDIYLLSGVKQMVSYKTIKSGNYNIELTTDRSGRTSIVVKMVTGMKRRIMVDIELPCTSGKFTASFAPRIVYDVAVFRNPEPCVAF